MGMIMWINRLTESVINTKAESQAIQLWRQLNFKLAIIFPNPSCLPISESLFVDSSESFLDTVIKISTAYVKVRKFKACQIVLQIADSHRYEFKQSQQIGKWRCT